jgi:cytochrome P450
VGLAALCLFAGFETTSSATAYAIVELMRCPEQADHMRSADDRGLAVAVEELMRFITPLDVGVGRVAAKTFELAGETIEEGDAVVINALGANWDPERFPSPDALDCMRDATGELSFGGGRHLCLGIHLARAEMEIALSRLLRRFPDLHLAVPAEEIEWYGLAEIRHPKAVPCAW